MTLFKQVQIDSYLKKPDEKIKAVLLYGANEGLVAQYVKSFIKTVCKDVYDAFFVTYLDFSKVSSDFGLLSGEYNSQSLMGGRRAIVLADADNNLTKHLKSLFENNKSDNLLIIYGGALARNSSLVTLATAEDYFACIACYEDRDEDIYSAAKEMFIKNGITIGREALQVLCSRLSNDRKSSIGEIEKLLTYIGTRKNVELEDVIKVVSDVCMASMDDLCFNTASGDSDNSQKTYVKLINENNEPISMIRTLYYHFEKLLKARSVFDETGSIDKAFSSIVPRVIFFRENAFKKQISLWNRDKILSVFELLYACEKDCKTTNMPSEEIFSYALMQICGAAKKSY